MVRYSFTVRLLHSLHPARYGAFGTGVGATTRHPQTGAASATKVAIWELAENRAAYSKPLRTEARTVTQWFPYGNLLILWGEFRARTSNQIHQHQSH